MFEDLFRSTRPSDAKGTRQQACAAQALDPSTGAASRTTEQGYAEGLALAAPFAITAEQGSAQTSPLLRAKRFATLLKQWFRGDDLADTHLASSEPELSSETQIGSPASTEAPLFGGGTLYSSVVSPAWPQDYVQSPQPTPSELALTPLADSVKTAAPGTVQATTPLAENTILELSSADAGVHFGGGVRATFGAHLPQPMGDARSQPSPLPNGSQSASELLRGHVTADTSAAGLAGAQADKAVATTNAASSTNNPLPADAAIALDLQAKGATFGNGGNETTAMTLGNTGSGITVGILSDSFNTSGNSDTMATDIAAGYLPTNTDDILDSPNGSDEGRAMAQIVHQVAPGANIDFETANNTQQEFANNILNLASKGCKVIVDDFIYYAEPDYQQGVVAQAIAKVESEGVVYLTAAQNNASQGYEGAFVPGETFSYGGQTYTADNFGAGASGPSNSLLKINGGALGAVVNLQWATPAASAGGTGATSQLALFVTNSAGTVQPMGGNGYSNSNVIGGDPIQQVIVPAGSTYYLEVGLASGSQAPADIKITADDGAGDVTLATVASNINSGTTSGHVNAPGIIAVGAADFEATPAYGTATPQNESFSSAGPDYVYYDNSGNLLATPRVANVALTGVDGVQTSFFDEYGSVSGTTGYYFYGTSAAAPSIAGVAALMLQENANLTPADVKDLLQDSATAQTTVDSSGNADPLIGGSGLVDGQTAIQFSQLSSSDTLTINATGTVLGTHFDDVLTGNAGANTLTGGGGADTFVFTATNFTAAQNGSASTVTDYNQGNSGTFSASEGDKVDVSAIVGTAYDNGAAADGLVRVDTEASGPLDLQLYGNGVWTAQTVLGGLTLSDGVTAVLDSNGATDIALFHVGAMASSDLDTALSGISGATQSGLRYDVEVETAGLASAQTLALGAGQAVTVQVDTGTTTLTGNITGSGSLAAAGTGTLILSGTNSYTGTTAIDGGTLAVSRDPNLGSTTGTPGGLSLAGGTLETTAGFSTARAVTLNGNGTVQVDAEQTTSFTGLVSGNAGLFTKSGTGTLMLADAGNSYVGNTILSAGTLEIGADGALGNARNQLTLGSATSAATLEITAPAAGSPAFSSARAIQLDSSAAIQVDTGTATLSGNIDGGGNGDTLTKTGAGTLLLSGKNGYDATTAVSAGQVDVSNAGALGTGAVALQNGTALGLENVAIRNKVSVSGDPDIDVTGTGNSMPTYTGPAGTVTNILGTDDSSSSDVLTLTSNDATYAGATNVGFTPGGATMAVTLRGGATDSFGATSAVTLGAGSVLDLGGHGQAVGTLASSAGTNGTVTNSGAQLQTLTVGGGNASAASTYGGLVQDGSSGQTALAVNGGTLELANGSNSYSGGTTIGVAGSGTGSALQLDTAGAAGSGTIGFAALSGSATAMLSLTQAAQPTPGTFFMAGTTFGNTLLDFNAGDDELDLEGFAFDPLATSYTSNGQSLTVVGGSNEAENETFALSNGAADYIAQRDAAGTGTLITAVCFCTGTLIRVERDAVEVDVAVEALATSDVVVTASGAHRPIVWIGNRLTRCASHPSPGKVWPVRVRAEAFGPGLPYADLWLSPGHALCLADMLVPVRGLIDGERVVQVERAEVTYWHVEVEGGHDVLLANGMPAESYLDTGNRRFFGDGAVTGLHFDDEPAPGWDGTGTCLPLVESGPRLSAIRTLYGLGQSTPTQPGDAAGVHLVAADGTVIPPCVANENELRFVVPIGSGDLRLTSPCFYADGDVRRLGVLVSGIAVSDGAGWREIALDHRGLYAGFHDAERDGECTWRWTDGSGHLATSSWDELAGPVMLRFTGIFRDCRPSDAVGEQQAA